MNRRSLFLKIASIFVAPIATKRAYANHPWPPILANVTAVPYLDWQSAFICSLSQSGSVRAALKDAGISWRTLQCYIELNPDFSALVDRTLNRHFCRVEQAMWAHLRHYLPHSVST